MGRDRLTVMLCHLSILALGSMSATLLSSFPLAPKTTPAKPAALEAETEGRF